MNQDTILMVFCMVIRNAGGVKDDGLLLDGRDDYIEFEGIINRYF
ncbi:MAG: hypothetical protein R2784_04305 [Saprospiraceae bacterium]